MPPAPKPAKRVTRDIAIKLVAQPAVELRPHHDADAIKELADSFDVYDVLYPIIVCTVPGRKRYELVAGGRRLRAARQAGLTVLPAIIYDELSRAQRIKMALVENVHRQDLEPMWEANAYRILQEEEGLTDEQIAREICKRVGHVRNRLLLLGLPPKVQSMVKAGKLPVKTAEVIAKSGDPQVQKSLAMRYEDKTLDHATLRRMVQEKEIKAQRQRREQRDRQRRKEEEEQARRSAQLRRPVPAAGKSQPARGKPLSASTPPRPQKKSANPHILPTEKQDDRLRVITEKCEAFLQSFLFLIDLREFDNLHLRNLRALSYSLERELNLFGQKIAQHQSD